MPREKPRDQQKHRQKQVVKHESKSKEKGGENTGVNVLTTMAGLGLIEHVMEATEAVSAISTRNQDKNAQVCLKPQDAIKPRERMRPRS